MDPFESDPAAEFLSREREQLGDILGDSEGMEIFINFHKLKNN
jgi:hypothetical protein